jgi:hypothetical protein
VLQIGNKKLVRSVPKELDKDQAELLLLAQVNKAYESPTLLWNVVSSIYSSILRKRAMWMLK